MDLDSLSSSSQLISKKSRYSVQRNLNLELFNLIQLGATKQDGNIRAIEFLIQLGANVDYQNTKKGSHP